MMSRETYHEITCIGFFLSNSQQHDVKKLGKSCIFRFDDVYETQIVFMNVAEHRAIPKSFEFNFFQISKNL